MRLFPFFYYFIILPFILVTIYYFFYQLTELASPVPFSFIS